MASTRRRSTNESEGRVLLRRTSSSKLSGKEKSMEKKSKANIVPLRRGDACLMCRAKKLRCSAAKPACDQCSKRNDRCVYDAVRPASRVEKLEKKLAEMEEEEAQRALSAEQGGSGTNTPQPTPFLMPSPRTHAHPFQLGSSYDMGLVAYQPPPYFALQNQQPALNTMVMARPQSLPETPITSLNGNSRPTGPSNSLLPSMMYFPPSTSNLPVGWASTASTDLPLTPNDLIPALQSDGLIQASPAFPQPALAPGLELMDPLGQFWSNRPRIISPTALTTPPQLSPTLLGPVSDIEDIQHKDDYLNAKESYSDASIPPTYPHSTLDTGTGTQRNANGLGLLPFEEKDISQAARDYMCVDPWL